MHGVFGDLGLELQHQHRVPSERQFGFDALLHRHQPQLVQPFHVDPSKRLELEIRQRPPPPQRFGLAKGVRRCFEVARLQRIVSQANEVLELMQIELARFQAQQVARSAGLHAIRVCTIGAQRPAQPRDLHPKLMIGAVGRCLRQQLIDEPVPRDGAVRAQEQDRQ